MSKKITIATGFVSAVLLLIYNIYTRMTVLFKTGIAASATKIYMVPGIIGAVVLLLFLGFLFFTYGSNKIYVKLSAAVAFVSYFIAQLILWVYSFRSPLLKVLPRYGTGMIMLQIGFMVVAMVALAALFFLLAKEMDSVRKILGYCCAALFALNGLLNLMILMRVKGTGLFVATLVKIDLDTMNGVAILLLFVVFAAFLIAEWSSIVAEEK